MKAGFSAALLAAFLLAGCGSHPEIPVGDQQTLVMESNVLAAGISAEKPELTRSEIQATASAKLFNERREPVTLHYRFYWYEARGLEMHPLERHVPSPSRLWDRSRCTAAPAARAHIKSDCIFIL